MREILDVLFLLLPQADPRIERHVGDGAVAGDKLPAGQLLRITSYNVCYTKLLRVLAGSHWGQADGQVMFVLIISLGAAEASIGLALLLQLYRRFNTLNVDLVSEMRG